MRKVKAGEEEVEFLEEADVSSLFEGLFQAAGRRGVSEKLIDKSKKNLLKRIRKAEKAISKNKADSEELRRMRDSTRRLEEIVKDPPSYTREVITEILKSL